MVGAQLGLIALGLFSGCGAPPGRGAEERPDLPTTDKVGVVDVGRVMRDTGKGQQIVVLLTDAERQIQNRVADLMAELETIADDVEEAQASEPVDRQRLGALAAEYRATAEEAERIRGLGDRQLSEYRMELTLPLLQEIEEACELIGRDEEYDLIVDRAALSFADDAVDLTERIISEVGGGAASGALIREALRDGEGGSGPSPAPSPRGSPDGPLAPEGLQLPTPAPGGDILQLQLPSL